MASPKDLAFFRKLADDVTANRRCFDCGADKPQWADTHHAILICLDCAGCHRGLGVHLSFVRSTTMDTWHDWKPEVLRRMRAGGNERAAAFFAKRSAPVPVVRADRPGCDRESQRRRYVHHAAMMYRDLLDAEMEGKPFDEATWQPPAYAQGVVGSSDGSQGACAACSYGPGEPVLYRPEVGGPGKRAVVLQVNKTSPPSYLVQLGDGSRRGAREDQLEPRQVSAGVRAQLAAAVEKIAETGALVAARTRELAKRVMGGRSSRQPQSGPGSALLTLDDDEPECEPPADSPRRGIDFSEMVAATTVTGPWDASRKSSQSSVGQAPAPDPVPAPAAAPPAARSPQTRAQRRRTEQSPAPAPAPTPAPAPAPAPAAPAHDPFSDFMQDLTAPVPAPPRDEFEAFLGAAVQPAASSPAAAPPAPGFAFVSAPPPTAPALSAPSAMDDIFGSPMAAPAPAAPTRLAAPAPVHRDAADPFSELLDIMAAEPRSDNNSPAPAAGAGFAFASTPPPADAGFAFASAPPPQFASVPAPVAAAERLLAAPAPESAEAARLFAKLRELSEKHGRARACGDVSRGADLLMALEDCTEALSAAMSS